MTSYRLADTRFMAFVLGLTGAIGLIAVFHSTRRGFWIFVAYAVFVIGIGAYERFRQIGSFMPRFSFALATFMIASLIDDGYLLLFDNPRALHAGPWALLRPQLLMLLIGGVLSLIVAAMAGLGRRRDARLA